MNGHLDESGLSDLVDGAGSAEAADHVAECESCANRLEVWRGTAARLGGVLSVPDGRREEAVAAAMAAVTTRPGAGRLWTHRRLVGGLAAAAAALAGLGVGLAQVAGSGGHPAPPTASGATSTVAPAAAPAAGPAGASNATGASSGAGSSVSGAPPATADLGSLTGPSALVAAVDRALATATPPSAPASASVSGAQSTYSPASPTRAVCPTGAGLPSSGSPPVLVLRASTVYQKLPAQVFVYRVGSGRQAVVLSDRNCAVLARVPV